MRAGIILFLSLLLSACNTFDLEQLGNVSTTLQRAFVPATASEEQEIGREAAAILLGAAPLLENPKIQGYVNRVGLWIALQSERPDIPWRFAVLDDPDINAFAAPGGYIFITTGLLVRLQNEAELAGVLAHEIAHVIAGHHLDAIRKEARLSLAGMAAGAALREHGQDPEQLKALAGGARLIYSRGLERSDEYHADRLGVVLAARAGYDPYGLVSVLQTLARINPQASELGLLMKTHPRPQDRIDRLDRSMRGPLDGMSGFQLGEERFRQQLAQLGHL